MNGPTVAIDGPMVERAARALFEDPSVDPELSWDEVVRDDPSRADIWRDDARRVLTGALSHSNPNATVYLVHEVDGTSISATPHLIGVALTEADAQHAVDAGDPPYRVRSWTETDVLTSPAGS